MKKTKKLTIIGYIAKSELSRYINTPIEKANGTPIILEIWKDGEDLRYCVSGAHLVRVRLDLTKES